MVSKHFISLRVKRFQMLAQAYDSNSLRSILFVQSRQSQKITDASAEAPAKAKGAEIVQKDGIWISTRAVLKPLVQQRNSACQNQLFCALISRWKREGRSILKGTVLRDCGF